jgi:ABC-type oligopeptide transport system substrate-binding subunit
MKKKLLTTLALISLSATLTACVEVKSTDSQKDIQNIATA